jgi:1,4-dihydroxy-2-naphthoyl-CoA synthase
VIEWRPSDPEPGKDYPGPLARALQITMNRPGVRNASQPRIPFELPNVLNAIRDVPVIILTMPRVKPVLPAFPGRP